MGTRLATDLTLVARVLGNAQKRDGYSCMYIYIYAHTHMSLYVFICENIYVHMYIYIYGEIRVYIVYDKETGETSQIWR